MVRWKDVLCATVATTTRLSDPSDTDGQDCLLSLRVQDCCLLLRLAGSEHGFLELGRAACSAKLGGAAISTGSPIGRQDT
jgi:hypothetical protein